MPQENVCNLSGRPNMARAEANGHAQSPKQPEKGHNGVVKLSSTGEDEATDLRRWRLLDERGRQTWHYLEREEHLARWPQSTADKYFLDLPLVRQSSSALLKILSCNSLTKANNRIYPLFYRPRLLFPPPETRSPSSLTSNSHLGTGPANMAVLCSSSQVWSLPGM